MNITRIKIIEGDTVRDEILEDQGTANVEPSRRKKSPTTHQSRDIDELGDDRDVQKE
jgi:hypothetical protein